MSQRTGVVSTAIAGILFGTSVPLIKLGLAYIPPDVFVALRFSIAASIVLALPARGEWIRRDLLGSRQLWIVIIINAAGYVLQFQGQRLTTSSNAALIISTAALMVPVLALIYGSEKLGLRKVVGVVAGFLGTGFVITRGASLTVAASELVGDFMILGTAVTIALIFVLSKPIIETNGPRPVAGGIILLTTLLLLLASLLDIGLPFNPTPLAWFYIVFLAVFATVGAYYFFTKGLETVSPIVSSIILPIEVIVAVGLSVLIFGDPFNIVSGTGAVLIVAGVILVSTSTRDT
ncbi:MAG TPA: DMT family transporter [Candidatus Bathyarchaeia archaeon]|nr:DMT family transporter [Candidatus Bathyarchaeia archaeon]